MIIVNNEMEKMTNYYLIPRTISVIGRNTCLLIMKGLLYFLILVVRNIMLGLVQYKMQCSSSIHHDQHHRL